MGPRDKYVTPTACCGYGERALKTAHAVLAVRTLASQWCIELGNSGCTVGNEQDAGARHEDRHSHIGIRLGCRFGEAWQHVEAIGWNDVGFNFFSDQDIPNNTLEFRRGLTRFVGTVAWRAINTDDAVVLAALVNALIYRRANEVVASNAALHKRLIKLVRTPGLLEQKRGLLSSLGIPLDDAQVSAMVEQRKREQPTFHFGVKVESDAWRAIVADALQLSSVVIAMEKWSGATAGIPK